MSRVKNQEKICYAILGTLWRTPLIFRGPMQKRPAQSCYVRGKGALTWADTSHIERIRRAHAQKHNITKQNWGKNQESKRPWFYKQYQSGSCSFFKDHEVLGHGMAYMCFLSSSGASISTFRKRLSLYKEKWSKKRPRGCSTRTELGSKGVSAVVCKSQVDSVFNGNSVCNVLEKCDIHSKTADSQLNNLNPDEYDRAFFKSIL